MLSGTQELKYLFGGFHGFQPAFLAITLLSDDIVTYVTRPRICYRLSRK